MQTFTKPFIRIPEVVTSILTWEEGLVEIFKYVDSGKVITRDKIDTKTGVLHPGIIIGVDRYGRIWVAHNHVSNKQPTYDVLEKYLDGKQMIYDNRPVKFSPEEIAERTIAEVQLGKRYTWITYNCQHFVNLIVRNEHKSEAIDKISNGVMAIGLGGAVAAFGFKKNGWGIAGLILAGIAAGTKGASRVP